MGLWPQVESHWPRGTLDTLFLPPPSPGARWLLWPTLQKWHWLSSNGRSQMAWLPLDVFDIRFWNHDVGSWWFWCHHAMETKQWELRVSSPSHPTQWMVHTARYLAGSYPTQTPELILHPACLSLLHPGVGCDTELFNRNTCLPSSPGPFLLHRTSPPVCPLPHSRNASLPSFGNLVTLPGQILPHLFQEAFSLQCLAVAGVDHD